MRLSFRALAPLALLGALACSTVSVTRDYDPTVDFTTYHTYGWLLEPPGRTGRPQLDSPLMHERIHKAIDDNLASKGFTQSATPDFLVRYDLTAQQKLDVQTDDAVFYGGYGYAVGLPETTVRTYDEGTLVIDIVDDRAKKVAWRGIGQGRLRGASAESDPATMQQRVDGVIGEVLADFPPTKK